MPKEFADQAIETDVLVIGGGIAGPRAAIEAKTKGAKVLMIVKGIYGASGCSLSPSTASAIGPWSDPRDSVEKHLKDMIINGKKFLCDQELTKIQAHEGGERLLELEKWGMVWDRDSQGKISLFPSSKLFPGTAVADRWITFGRRGTHAVGPFWTGHGTVDILRDEVNREAIPYMEETAVSRILVTGNRVTGAVAYDYLNCRIVLIKCSAVIIASGDAGMVYYPHTMVSGEGTGDGFSLAYEAGAQLVNMEQFEYIAMMHAYPDSARTKAALESATEPGRVAYLLNSRGERFMERYCPETKELSTQEELAKAIWQEVKEGRGGSHGGVFLDLRHIPKSVAAKGVPGRFELIEKLGYDIGRDLIEVFPVVHTTTGGIRINPECGTRVNGLFAAGQVAFAISDNLGEGATGIVDALVWGKRAGQFAAACARTKRGHDPSEGQVEEEARLLTAPLRTTSEVSPVKIARRLQRAMWEGASIIKNEESLRRALQEIVEIRKMMLSEMSARTKTGMFNLEMREAIEVRHMLNAAEMIVRSSLARKESRNRFHRSDYPKQDDKHWLKHIIVEKTNRGMRVTTNPVKFPYVKLEVSR
jgi:fumarate reductase (CoM/CoB) subunit A